MAHRVIRWLACSLLLTSCVTRDLDGLTFNAPGNEPNGALCSPAFAPCGGNPVGEWNLEETCGVSGFASAVRAMCTAAKIETDVRTNFGLLRIDDRSYSIQNAREAAMLEAVWPAACLQGRCVDEASRIQASVDEDVTCTETDNVCRCRITSSTSVFSFSDEYVLYDNLIDLSFPNRPGKRFCVDADRLEVRNDCTEGPGCEHTDVFVRW